MYSGVIFIPKERNSEKETIRIEFGLQWRAPERLKKMVFYDIKKYIIKIGNRAAFERY